ncbi:hypothetical protein PHISCL_09137, partial [Aspergillus sclerotialis]
LAPSLSLSAIVAQQPQIYTEYVMRCYPCLFKCIESRVPVTCFDWINALYSNTSDYPSAPTPLDWSLRAQTTTYIGLVHNDDRLLEAGNIAYIKGLKGLGRMLSNPERAKSDDALTTAMGLAIYEKYAHTMPDSWLRHAAGLRALMKLRGAGCALQGFGQTMYMAYRQLFITAALISGEECFLEGKEWMAVSEQLAIQNAKQPDSSVYTDIVERGFREMTRVPGYVKRTRELLSSQSPSAEHPKQKQKTKQSQSQSQKQAKAVRKSLLQSILATRAALRGIHTELGISSSMLQSGTTDAGFIGPIPYVFFDSFSTRTMRGIRSGIVVLNCLVALLDPVQRDALERENRTLLPESFDEVDHGNEKEDDRYEEGSSSFPTPPQSAVEVAGNGKGKRTRLVIENLISVHARQMLVSDWMDRLMTTYGMDGVRVYLVDED